MAVTTGALLALSTSLVLTTVPVDLPSAGAPIAVESASAYWTTPSRVAITGTAAGHEGAVVELQRDGDWAGVGQVTADGTFTNPGVPDAYLRDHQAMTLRVRDGGQLSAPTTVPVPAAVFDIAADRNPDGTISVRGSASTPGVPVEVWNDGWRGVAVVGADGRFANGLVPGSYALDPDTIRARVRSSVPSAAVDATLGFHQSRTLASTPDVSRETERRRLRNRIYAADYRPTGYFAPAGVPVTIDVSGVVGDLTALVGTQGLADRDDPSTQSPNMRATVLHAGENRIVDPVGGAIHLKNVTDDGRGEPVRITVGGTADPMPYFVQGRTTHAEWKQMLAATEAPEVEIAGDDVVIAALLPSARSVQDHDPAAALASHQRILAAEHAVNGLDGSDPTDVAPRLPLYAVESRSTGNPFATTGHIGIPHRPVGEDSYYVDALLTEQAEHSWVMLHEYGHHQQTTSNTYSDMVEVSVNLSSLAVARATDNEYTDVLPERWAATQRFLAQGAARNDFRDAPDPQAVFEQLRRGLGTSFLQEWGKRSRAQPCVVSGDAAEKRCFVVSASAAAGRDLTAFFATWGILRPDETATWDAVRALGLPEPSVDLTTLEPYVLAEVAPR